MKKNNPILSASDLSCYIFNYFKKETGKSQLSDIWLQKSLYFLFAYWGGFIRQGHIDNNLEVEKYSEILFGDVFEAWTYGPVVAQLYYAKKDGDFSSYYENEYNGDDTLFSGDSFLQTTIDSILSDLVKIDPFRLVTLSHRDKCWKDNYDECADKHHCEISKESIIEEYATKFSS